MAQPPCLLRARYRSDVQSGAVDQYKPPELNDDDAWQECSRGLVARAWGRVEGERALLRRLLRRRFGPLSPETVERLGQASVRDPEA